ncbi:MAG: zmp6 [Solirubrobacterales bacterium]|nr:zmp6 [Solirubrobacterales bacterium]
MRRTLVALGATSLLLGAAGTATAGTVIRDVIVDANGTTHTRMDRTYRGLAVLGGDMVVHRAANGTRLGVSRTLRAMPALSTAPALRLPGTLVVEARGMAPRLAWQLTTVGVKPDGTPSRMLTTYDAITGAKLVAEEQIENVTGSGTGRTNGTVPLETTQSGSSYTLKDPTRGNTYTVDAQNKSDTCAIIWCSRAATVNFTDADNVWGDGSLANRQTIAVDAQFGTNETWDYYKTVHGRNGIANDGKGSYNRVHYGSNYENAFWDDSCFCMTYGDGGTSFWPLTSLDVAGHEMSHGVTSRTANLTYSGESGGLNEANSDIFGTLVEFYANRPTDPPDYTIGEAISKTGKPLRWMDQPSKDGHSADCWSSSVGNLDVHYSSGVANHFAYLLAVGSGASSYGTSPTCNGSTVTGIGNDALGKIWYRALTVYMTSSTNYKGARAATLSAATDLYGAGSANYNAVAAAWSAVNVT